MLEVIKHTNIFLLYALGPLCVAFAGYDSVPEVSDRGALNMSLLDVIRERVSEFIKNSLLQTKDDLADLPLQ